MRELQWPSIGSANSCFLALGQYVSPRLVLQELANLGAKDGMLLDGGGSSSMAIGKDAAGGLAGGLYGGWRAGGVTILGEGKNHSGGRINVTRFFRLIPKQHQCFRFSL